MAGSDFQLVERRRQCCYWFQLVDNGGSFEAITITIAERLSTHHFNEMDKAPYHHVFREAGGFLFHLC